MADLKHRLAYSCSFFPGPDDNGKERAWAHLDAHWELDAPPGQTEEDDAERDSVTCSEFGQGAGSTGISAQGGLEMGKSNPLSTASIEGISGVISNPFAKEDLVKVDVEPNLRRDMWLETYCCLHGCAWFFKLPDCLGIGADCTSFCGQYACTIKALQKPTLCECVGHCVAVDLSTMCSDRGENDNTCISLWGSSCQLTYCCVAQYAGKCNIGIMRTCLQGWLWAFCIDTRCAFPPNSFAPLQCLICGLGYRGYGGNNGISFRARADDTDGADPAEGSGNNGNNNNNNNENNNTNTNTNTTVVNVVMQAPAPVAPPAPVAAPVMASPVEPTAPAGGSYMKNGSWVDADGNPMKSA